MTGLLNSVWMATCLRESRAFSSATKNVAATQAQVLAEIVRDNLDTAFGKSHRFDSISSPTDFQRHVPLAQYEDFAPYIARIAAGESNILTRDPITLLQPTSGTLGGEKLIPYGAPLRRQFQRMIKAWIADLFRNRPAVRAGRAYWSISPAMPRRNSPGGLPIGFDDDAEYLTAAEQWMARRVVVTPGDAVKEQPIEQFRYTTLLALLHADDLALISIWSPTFLLALLAPLDAWADRLCHDIARIDAKRAAQVRKILMSAHTTAERCARLWPRLAVISCWADASSAPCAAELAAIFPHVELQPKGLLATEGCVAFPLVGQPAPALAIRSHFFEFQAVEDPNRISLAHELDVGARYNVIMTTAGGLYRYQLRDTVEVVQRESQCPLLRFIGKADQVCDMVGEKLAEPFVGGVLATIFARRSLRPRFAMLVPIASLARYRLYFQLDAPVDIDAAFPHELDAALAGNPHYAYARKLGQLAPIEVTQLDARGPSAWSIYERELLRRGVRAGNIKPTALDRSMNWPELFLNSPR